MFLARGFSVYTPEYLVSGMLACWKLQNGGHSKVRKSPEITPRFFKRGAVLGVS